MPISKKQLIANRKNALKSTGPKTVEGKAISSQNSLKHGLTSTNVVLNSTHYKEDKVEFDALIESLIDELNPQTFFQKQLVLKIGACLWRTKRIVMAETSQINRQLNFLDENYYFKKYNNQLNQIDITPEQEAQYRKELSNLIGIKSVPKNESASTLIRYEHFFDIQLIRTYKLLKQLQIENYFESIQDRYKKAENHKTNPLPDHIDNY